jgi:hypothetical protein
MRAEAAGRGILTVPGYSRHYFLWPVQGYLLDCHGLAHPRFDQTKPRFERAFRNYGLPQAIRTDNGFPFASTGLG